MSLLYNTLYIANKVTHFRKNIIIAKIICSESAFVERSGARFGRAIPPSKLFFFKFAKHGSEMPCVCMPLPKRSAHPETLDFTL